MEMNLPTRDECIAHLQRAGCPENVIQHCLAVERIALKIAGLANADMELVSTGALLHDIGRSKTHGAGHGVEGGRIARELNLPEDVVAIIERHVGAGLTKEDAEILGLPKLDYIPSTLEEKIVAEADNLIDDTRKVGINIIIKRLKDLKLEEAAQKVLALHEELCDLCNQDLDGLE